MTRPGLDLDLKGYRPRRASEGNPTPPNQDSGGKSPVPVFRADLVAFDGEILTEPRRIGAKVPVSNRVVVTVALSRADYKRLIASASDASEPETIHARNCLIAGLQGAEAKKGEN